SLARPVAKAPGTPLPVACRRVSDGRALRLEKLASAGPPVNSFPLKRSLEAGFFQRIFACEEMDKLSAASTPSRLMEALGSALSSGPREGVGCRSLFGVTRARVCG